jgi:transglutaminase-like putative cysteine protease
METLRRGEGSCRDLTVLYLAIARSQGFAGRFVSGYHVDPGTDGQHDLHAWPEIYVPGGGWRGVDPTTGLAVADLHVRVAVGALAQQASPVSGTYAGSATSELETYVDIKPMESLTRR